MKPITITVHVKEGIPTNDPRVTTAAQQALTRLTTVPVTLHVTGREPAPHGMARITLTSKAPREGRNNNPTPTKPKEGAWSHHEPASPHTSASDEQSSDETNEQA